MSSVVQLTVKGERRSMMRRPPIVYRLQLTRPSMTSMPPSQGFDPAGPPPNPDTSATPANDKRQPPATEENGTSRINSADRKAVMAGLAPMTTPAGAAPRSEEH